MTPRASNPVTPRGRRVQQERRGPASPAGRAEQCIARQCRHAYDIARAKRRGVAGDRRPTASRPCSEPCLRALPPHNLEAERAALGACLVAADGIAVAREVLNAGDFWRDAHARIWRAIGAVEADQLAIDLITVRDRLAASGDMDAVGGPAYVAALADGVPRSTNVAHYARLVRKAALARRALPAAGRHRGPGGAGRDRRNRRARWPLPSP